jgi:hypothetical protein
MTRTTTTTTTTRRLAATAALVLTTLLGGAGVSAASVDQPTDAGNDYVRMLLAKAESAEPYSLADDYVDTLVYWHHHPRWGFES